MVPKPTALIFTSREIAYFASLLKSDNLFGYSQNYLKLDDQIISQVEKGLIDRRVVIKEDSSTRISPQYLPVIKALFKPDRILELIKDTPGKGKQRAIFIHSAGKLLFHSQPQEGKHSLVLIDQEGFLEMVSDWYQGLPGGFDPGFSMEIEEAEFEKIRILSESGKTSNASEKLIQSGIESHLAEKITSQIVNRSVSGVFAFYLYEGTVLSEISSFAFFAGDLLTWVILAGEKQDSIQISSQPALFESTLNQFEEMFLMNKEAMFKSFVLTREMLAVSFHLINQTQLGLQFLKKDGGTGDFSDLEKIYQGTVQKMIEVGLCSQPQGNVYPQLVPSLERSLGPIVMGDELVIARLSREQFGSEARIFCSGKESFTALLENDVRLVLETGRFENLPVYILELFKGFHPVDDPGKANKVSLSYKKLLNVVDAGRDPGKIALILEPEISDEKTRKVLTQDIATTVFRGFIQRRILQHKNIVSDDKEKKPVILLLQGMQHSWLFSFADEQGEELGIGEVVTREQFASKVVEFLH